MARMVVFNEGYPLKFVSRLPILRKSLLEKAMLILLILFFGTIAGTIENNDFVILHQQQAYGQLDFIQPGVQQEICFNGFDDDANGFVDDSCPTGIQPVGPEVSQQLSPQPFVGQFGNVTIPDNFTVGQPPVSPEVLQYMPQQQIVDQFGYPATTTPDNSTQQQFQYIQQQLLDMQQQLQSIQLQLQQPTQELLTPIPPANQSSQSPPANQSSQSPVPSLLSLQDCIKNAVSQGMTNVQIRQQCGLSR
jgi:hypothetical protein